MPIFLDLKEERKIPLLERYKFDDVDGVKIVSSFQDRNENILQIL